MRAPVIAVPEQGEKTIVSSSAARYGIMMGGPKSIRWDLIGEMAIGHQQIDRRDLTLFTNIDVGRRNESETAINDESPSLHMEWYRNPDRIVTKTARDCANDVKSLYGEIFGFAIPEILIGLGSEKAESLFNTVLPKSIAEGALVNVISHLSSQTFEDFQAERLRVELLTAAYVCQENLTKYVTALKAEAGIARDKGTGKKGPDPVEVEYFRELNVPLPEEVPALATMAMGQELGKQFAQASGGNDAILRAILEQNQLLMSKFAESEASQQAQTQETTEPAPHKAVGTKKDK